MYIFFLRHGLSNITGAYHDMMALIELAAHFTQYLEPTKQRAEDRIDELSGIIRGTTLRLGQWDSETEESVRVLNQTRDEQVSDILYSIQKL